MILASLGIRDAKNSELYFFVLVVGIKHNLGTV